MKLKNRKMATKKKDKWLEKLHFIYISPKNWDSVIPLNEFQCRQYCYRVFHIEHLIRREVIKQGPKEVVKVSLHILLYRNLVFAGCSKRHSCNTNNSYNIKKCKKLCTKKKKIKSLIYSHSIFSSVYWCLIIILALHSLHMPSITIPQIWISLRITETELQISHA